MSVVGAGGMKVSPSDCIVYKEHIYNVHALHCGSTGHHFPKNLSHIRMSHLTARNMCVSCTQNYRYTHCSCHDVYQEKGQHWKKRLKNEAELSY